MPESKRIITELVEAVTAPLGFFVLALLIVESFLAAALIGGHIDAQNQLTRQVTAHPILVAA